MKTLQKQALFHRCTHQDEHKAYIEKAMHLDEALQRLDMSFPSQGWHDEILIVSQLTSKEHEVCVLTFHTLLCRWLSLWHFVPLQQILTETLHK